jgi:hypothetical protein
MIGNSRVQMMRGLFAVTCLGVCLQVRAGSTIQDFDNPGSPFTLGNFGGPAASLVGPGNPGNAVQLTFAGIGGTQNSIGFDRTQVGAFQSLTADFDFRLAGAADGLSFALLNTANYGTSGAMPLPTSGIFEEPNYAGSLAVEFDTFDNGPPDDPNGNHIGLHFNNAEIANVTPSFQLGAGDWHHAHLEVDPVSGGGSDVTLTIDGGPPTFANLFVAGLDPYEGRVGFGARTGGFDEDALVDNINVSYGVAPVPSVFMAGCACVALLWAWRGRQFLSKATITV